MTQCHNAFSTIRIRGRYILAIDPLPTVGEVLAIHLQLKGMLSSPQRAGRNGSTT